MKVNKTLLVFVTLLLTFSVQSQTRDEQIAERLKPIGDVKISDAVASSGPQDPETVYNTFCAGCHASGAGNAPILGDVGAWSERIAQGTDVLYASGINGIGIMPAKGACAACSDDDIKATVDYMIAASQ